MDEKTISFLSDVGPEAAAPVLAELNKAIAENKVRNPSAYVTKALANLPRPGGGTWGQVQMEGGGASDPHLAAWRPTFILTPS